MFRLFSRAAARSRRRSVVAALVTAVAVVPLISASPAAASIDVVGVHDQRGLYWASPLLPRNANLVEAHQRLAGEDAQRLYLEHMWVRIPVDVALLDTSPTPDGVIDNWTFIEAVLSMAESAEVKVLPVFYSSAVPVPDTTAKRLAFAKAVASVLSHPGADWFVTAEIWNEPNNVEGFTGLHYGKLLGQVFHQTRLRGVIKRFVTGGLAEYPDGLSNPAAAPAPGTWLMEALDHSRDEIPAGLYGASKFFAVYAIGVHPYGWPNASPSSAANNTQAIYNAMDYLNQVTRPPGSTERVPTFWATEFGWKVAGAPGVAGGFAPAEVTSRTSAFLSWFDSWSDTHSGAYPSAVFAYSYRNAAPSSPQVHNGFGLWPTVGTTYANDTTQQNAGPPTSGAWDLLRWYAGGPGYS